MTAVALALVGAVLFGAMAATLGHLLPAELRRGGRRGRHRARRARRDPRVLAGRVIRQRRRRAVPPRRAHRARRLAHALRPGREGDRGVARGRHRGRRAARRGHDRAHDPRRAVRGGPRRRRGAHRARRRRARGRARPARASAIHRARARTRVDGVLRHPRQRRQVARRGHAGRSAARRRGDARQRIGGDGRVPPLPQRAAGARGRASEPSVRSPCPACSGACPTPPSSRPSTVDA